MTAGPRRRSAGAADDPYHTPEYPGYAPCVPCGAHSAGGKPWREALREEIDYLEQASQLPLLGSPGHTVDELLAQMRAGEKKPRLRAGLFSSSVVPRSINKHE